MRAQRQAQPPPDSEDKLPSRNVPLGHGWNGSRKVRRNTLGCSATLWDNFVGWQVGFRTPPDRPNWYNNWYQ